MNPQQYSNTPPQPPYEAPNNRFDQEETLDLKKYFYMILANWYWFVISVFIGLGVAWLLNRYTRPVYQAKASLILSENDRGRGGLTGYENLIPGMEIYRTRTMIANEMEVLKSYSLAKRTLDNLDFNVSYVGVGRSGFKEAFLYETAPFIVIPDTSGTNTFNYPVYIRIIDKNYYEVAIDDNFNINQKVAFGEKFESAPFTFSIKLRDPENFNPDIGYNKYYFTLNNANGQANSYRSRLSITPSDDKRGSVLFLSFAAPSSQLAADYLNKLMEVYIRQGLEEKNQIAVNTVKFIDGQLGVIDTSLQKAEMNLQNFRLANKLVSVTTEGSMAYARVQDFMTQKAMLELQSRYYDYLLKYVKDRNNLNQIVAPATMDISDPLLSGLITQLNDLLVQKEDLLFRVNSPNPQLSLLQSKIETTRKALLDNIESLIRNNTISMNEADRHLKEAGTSLEKLPVTERKLINIQRRYNVNDQIYTYLLQKRAEAAIAQASNVSDNKILDMARPENASLIAPKSKMNYMMGLLIGIFIPFGLLIFLDLLNNKITSRSEIERHTSIPVISIIGHNSGTGDVPVFENPKSSLSESFRGLRTNLQYLLPENDQKVITVTSTISGEGKTFCSVNLAAIFAMAGRKTLLMGLDLRKPKIHKIFNIENEHGISTCLIHRDKFSDIIRQTPIENLSVAPSGPIPPNPAELIGSDPMNKIMDEARKNYDIIILDTPPIGMVTDALLLSRISDLSLFLLRQNYSSKNILELFEDIYIKNEMGKMGIVLNDMKQRGYYGYGYRYYNAGYTYRYGYYSASNEYIEGEE